MLSLYSQASSLSKKGCSQLKTQPNVVERLENLQDAVVSFTDLAVRSGITSIRLHCTIPTWSSSTDTCDDLHDLHELHSRFILFIHDLLRSLRASGVSASHSLTPSNASLGFVCQRPINTAAVVERLRESNVQLKREQAGLVDLDGVPCLVIT